MLSPIEIWKRSWSNGCDCRSRDAEPLGGKVCARDRGSGAEEETTCGDVLADGRTYIRVKGTWAYLYRAVGLDGQTLDSTLSERRDLAAARRFFRRAISRNGPPESSVIDKSGSNLAGLQAVNVIVKASGSGKMIEIRKVKCRNTIIEQDHRFIKRLTRPMMSFKAVHSAAATIAGTATGHMIRKGQIPAKGDTAFQIVAGRAA